MGKKNKISLVFIFIIIVVGCNDNVKRKYKKSFYPSGRIKSQGWYINDSIPVDTVRTFFEGGNLLAKDIYDNIGNAILSIGYFENGKVHEYINYENGLANGFFYKYLESGTLANKAFFINDNQIGDTYYYNSSGQIKAYTFFDWEEKPINLSKYDSVTGNIKKDLRYIIYIDTINYSKAKLANTNKNILFCDIKVVVSNPPRCRSTVKINFISRNGALIKSDSITSKPYYSSKERFPDSLFSIKIFGCQYDSLSQKSTYQESDVKLNYEKE